MGAARGARVDRDLERWARELLAHDERLRGLTVEARFDGGVAHLSGQVSRDAELRLVRELVGRLAGVHAVWDTVRVAGREPVRLDVGCGAVKQYAGNVGVDQYALAGVDIVADVSRPLPFRSGSVDRIFAVHVLEHLLDFLPLLDECWRLLRPGGILHVLSPDWRHVNAVADPTHVRYLDVQTFKYLCTEHPARCRWLPLAAGSDGASVLADLTPVKGDQQPADETLLSRFFD
ncbi:MAG: BON domain-containing class I SAM-dependent methyltransferase [Actinomycetota bacterium]|nr:BON domain-containing class I SAM-dependent methyltransferase [Actinomycetota bacterium]